MKRFIDKDDLDLLNFILEQGKDIRITKTSYTVKIISETPKVMRKKEIEVIPDYKESE